MFIDCWWLLFTASKYLEHISRIRTENVLDNMNAEQKESNQTLNTELNKHWTKVKQRLTGTKQQWALIKLECHSKGWIVTVQRLLGLNIFAIRDEFDDDDDECEPVVPITIPCDSFGVWGLSAKSEFK
jgi:hypothetical protein